MLHYSPVDWDFRKLARAQGLSSGSLIILLGSPTAFGPLSIDMYLPAFPSIAGDLGVSAAGIQATLASFLVGMGLGQLIHGPLADQFGRKKNLIAGLGIYAFASALCAMAPSAGMLTAARFLQALGGCAGMVLSRAIVRDRFEGKDAARAFSTMMLIMGVAPILAPSLGGFFLAHFHWRLIFWFLSVTSLVALVVVVFFLPETLPPKKRTPSALRKSLGNYLSILRDREFVGYALSSGMLSAGMFSYIAASSFVFIKHHGFSEQQFAILFGVNAAGLIGASQLNTFLLRRLSSDQILQAVLTVFLFSGAILFLFASMDWFGVFGLILPLFFAVSCLGLSGPNATVGAMRNYGNRAGTASALLGTLTFGSGTLGAVLQSSFKSETPFTMSLQIALCGIFAWMFFIFMVKQGKNKAV